MGALDRGWLTLRFAGPVILSFALGIGLLQLRADLPDVREFSAYAAAVLIVGLAIWRRPRWRWVVWGLLALVLGHLWAAWRAEWRLAEALPLEWERRDIQIEGVVAELPREFDRGQRFRFNVNAVLTPDAVVPATIQLSWMSGPHENQAADARRVTPGERWRVTVRLKRPHGHMNPGGFDYEAWLLERGIRATGYVRTAPSPERLGEATGIIALPYEIERWRASIRSRLQAALPDAPWAGVIVALAIGDQGSISAEGWRVFGLTGTTHLMSISGLHVTMLAALAGWMVGGFWRRSAWLTLRVPVQRAAIVAGWSAALVYTLLSGAGVPALRTLLMLSVAALAHLLSRRVPVARILSLSLVSVLLMDPWAVLAVGFWLSFGAVALLLMAGYRWRDRESKLSLEDESPTQTGRHVGHRIGRIVREWGVAQWAVTVGSLPLLLWMFQQVSLVSPLANAVAIPLVSMVVSPLSVAAGLLPLPFLADLASWLFDGLMWFLVWLAEQPWAVWRQAKPPLWAVLLGVLGMVVHLWPMHKNWPRWLALLLLVPVLLPLRHLPETGEARVTVLDVGQGLAALVQTRNHVLLFDGGPRYSAESNAGERIVVPVARALGIQRFDGVVLSHRDTDHSGGIAAARREFPVGWLSTSVTDDHSALTGLPNRIRCEAGQRWEWDGVRFEFLSPFASSYLRPGVSSNRLSCVLLVEISVGQTERRALLTADLEIPDEAAMLAALKGRMPVDVVQVPHQGSRTSSSSAWIEALQPSVAIVPVGYRNPFAHPNDEVVGRYRQVGAEVLRTDTDGAVQIDLGQELTVSTAREKYPRYWQGR